MTSPFEQERKKIQQQRLQAIHDAKQKPSKNSSGQPSPDCQAPPLKTHDTSSPMDTVESGDTEATPSMEFQLSKPLDSTLTTESESSTTEQPQRDGSTKGTRTTSSNDSATPSTEPSSELTPPNGDGETTPPPTTVLPHVTAPIVPGVMPPSITADVPKQSPPSSTETTTSKTDLDEIIDVPNGPRLGAQIKLDVGRISGQVTDSGLRSLIGGYQRVVSPHFESDGDSHFPRSHKPHATFAHRSSMGGFGNVLLFHIGAAILAYYKIVRGEATGRDLAAVDRIHRIAERGATSFASIGTDFKGHALEPMMVDTR